MKKIKNGKLSLNRETVRGLQNADLANAVGGVLKTTAWYRCSFTHTDQIYPCPSIEICQ
jgi:hypothetical protein